MNKRYTKMHLMWKYMYARGNWGKKDNLYHFTVKCQISWGGFPEGEGRVERKTVFVVINLRIYIVIRQK